VVVEQILRPTGLMDPEIIVRPSEGQIDDLLEEIRSTVEKGDRVLVTTLTKRMSEDLTDYLSKAGVRVQYLHSEVESLDRVEILRNLRLAEFDVLVGINLLREGLDLPEVSLVAILDADKEGFLRSERSLMQTSGRAARNAAGRVIFYADHVTDSMQKVMDETKRRREAQVIYNEEHGITPQTIRKSIDELLLQSSPGEKGSRAMKAVRRDALTEYEREELIDRLTKEMAKAAENLNFETAALMRDELFAVKGVTPEIGRRQVKRFR
jgi:excinuclease ABC subunit B